MIGIATPVVCSLDFIYDFVIIYENTDIGVHDLIRELTSDPRLILLHPGDNVFVCCASIAAGEIILIEGQDIRVNEHIAVGHKVSRRRLEIGAKVLKHGAPIGSATAAVNPGDHVHLHNLASDYLPGGPPVTREGR